MIRPKAKRIIYLMLFILVVILLARCNDNNTERNSIDTDFSYGQLIELYPANNNKTIAGNEAVKENDENNKETSIAQDIDSQIAIKDIASDILVMFHNNRGPMYVQQQRFLQMIRAKCPKLVIEEHLTTQPGTSDYLRKLKAKYPDSQGVSSNFAYLPITFINNHAYSGFNAKVSEMIEEDILLICKGLTND